MTHRETAFRRSSRKSLLRQRFLQASGMAPTPSPPRWDPHATSNNDFAEFALEVAFGNLSGFVVTRVSETELRIRPSIGGLMGASLSDEIAEQLLVPLVNDLPQSIAFSGSFPVDPHPFNGTVTGSLQGSFSSTTS